MKLASFSYQRPANLADAIKLISDPTQDVRLVAGGQSLLAALNFRLGEPDLLVDLNHLTELAGITETADTIRVGAMTRHRDILESELLQRELPLIPRAMQEVAHPAIRNRGTLGGSVALADPAAEMPACILAYGASIVVNGPSGRRQIAADDYFLGLYETALEAGEIIEAITFPRQAKDHFTGFEEFSRRRGDFASAGVAITGLNINSVSQIKVVMFGIADKPLRATAAEHALSGQALNAQSIESAADLATEGIAVFGDGQTSEAMKRHLSRTLLTRALTRLLSSTH